MTGHADVAYGLATQTTQPSWGYMIANGATTLWEFWGGGNQISHNHPFLGSISEWFYEVLAGIDVDPAGPGYKKIIIKPHVVGDLTWVQGSVDTIRGEVVSDWTHGGNSLTFNVTLPGNSTAKVHVPKMGLSNITVTEGGNTIWQSGAYVPGVTGITAGTENNDYVIFDVGSGLYNFVLNGI
jgi:alpha-L-rhamnosidase